MNTLKYIAVRCNDTEATKSFYENIGLVFVKEQHGNGPEHYAAQLGDVVFELYPVTARYDVCSVRIGLSGTDSGTIRDPEGRIIDMVPDAPVHPAP
jgi:catechol 2,3-dioxygenase-like lactoylglutathione lyase family enzyme